MEEGTVGPSKKRYEKEVKDWWKTPVLGNFRNRFHRRDTRSELNKGFYMLTFCVEM